MRDPFWHFRAVALCDNDQRRPRYWTLDLPITKHRHKHKRKHKLRRRVSLVDCPVPVPVPIPFPSPSDPRSSAAQTQADIAYIPYPASILGPSPISSLGNRLDSDSEGELRPICFSILFWSTYTATPPCSSLLKPCYYSLPTLMKPSCLPVG
jgi:hypothetical protein